MAASRTKLDNEASIRLLVSLFYTEVRKDQLIGPIFNQQIEDWEDHLSHLTNFWITNLLFQPKFNGNPMVKHVHVDKAANHQISQLHFARWMKIWLETINQNFEGKNAELAKDKARKMSTHLFIKMKMSRKFS